MAISDYYVNSTTGNDATGDGSIATPWATIEKFLASAVVGSRGSRCNLTGTFVVSSPLDASRFGHYTSPPSFDGGSPGNAQVTFSGDRFVSAIHGTSFANMTILRGLTTSQQIINAVYFNCIIKPAAGSTSTYLINESSFSVIVNCTIDGENVAGLSGVSVNVGQVKGCLIKNLTGHGVINVNVVGCRFYNIGLRAVYGTNRGYAVYNSSFDTCSVSTEWVLTGISQCFFHNNIVSNSGIIFGTGGNPFGGHLTYYYNSTITTSSDFTALDSFVELTTSPFVDPSADNFTPTDEVQSYWNAVDGTPGAIQVSSAGGILAIHPLRYS